MKCPDFAGSWDVESANDIVLIRRRFASKRYLSVFCNHTNFDSTMTLPEKFLNINTISICK